MTATVYRRERIPWTPGKAQKVEDPVFLNFLIVCGWMIPDHFLASGNKFHNRDDLNRPLVEVCERCAATSEYLVSTGHKH